MPPLKGFVIMGEKKRIMESWDSGTTIFSIFVSSTETNKEQSDGFIANQKDGYELELFNCAQANAAMGSRTLQAAPYSTRLRPVTDISIFSSFVKVYLTKATFRILDATKVGEASQTASVLTAISDSLATDNDAIVQSRFKDGEIGGWEPNFFRPYLGVKGGINIFQSLSSSNYGSKANLGDLSIGRMLPFEYNPPMPIFIGEDIPKSEDALEVYAGAAQIVNVSGTKWIQRYPIIAEFEFLGIKP